MSAVSMHRGWQILSALRSDSREWPSRMGVGGWSSLFFDFEGDEKGLIGGGERSRRMLAWTCSRDVVTEARASAVIPDHLDGKKK